MMPSKKEVYGNFKVLSPDGILMFRCSEKKADWYIKRNLVSQIEPLTLKLNFYPKGLGQSGKNYGLEDIKNICVVCATNNNLNKHHVVPICYRKHFPEEKKSHDFHDVVLLCLDCHKTYENHATKFKIELSKRFDAPINQVSIKQKLVKMRSIAKCILSNDNKIPKYRLKDLSNEIKSYFSWSKISKRRLQNISNIEIKNSDFSHGKLVVSRVENLDEFIKDWRMHFIQFTNCQYLPKNWSIDYGLKLNCL